MADLNKITKQIKEEDIELVDTKMMNVEEMVELSPDEIKENKLKFTHPEEILEYIKTLKQKLGVEEKSRNEEIGKIDFYLYGDPKDNLTHYKGAIGRLQSWFSNQYLTNSAGRKDADTVVDGFKNIKVLQRQQADTFNKANFKMNYAIRCLDALYNDKFEELNKEIETLKAQLEQRSTNNIQEDNTTENDFARAINNTKPDLKKVIGEFMDLYGTGFMDRYMNEAAEKGSVDKLLENRIKANFIVAANKYFTTYYSDANQKAYQLWDNVLLNLKRKIKAGDIPQKKEFQSKINPKPEDVGTPEKEDLYVGEPTEPPNSSEEDIERD